jgi:pimeloyl-ACP methyl ester carboxylesterase
MNRPRAEDWRSRGGHFSWRQAAEDAVPVEIFHVELGEPGAPVLLLIHGWPTSSIDWFDVAGQLSARFRVCALAERSTDEQGWLTALASAPFPVTVIWGLYDTVSPPRVASYVWNQYLMLKPGGNRLYYIPDANHYLQVDRPDAFVKVLLHALEPAADQGPGALEAELDAPLLVDSSRERLPAAADVLHA